jgi:hypothetical protein
MLRSAEVELDEDELRDGVEGSIVRQTDEWQRDRGVRNFVMFHDDPGSNGSSATRPHNKNNICKKMFEI